MPLHDNETGVVQIRCKKGDGIRKKVNEMYTYYAGKGTMGKFLRGVINRFYKETYLKEKAKNKK